MGKEQAVIRIKELKWLRLVENGNSLATAVPWGKASSEHHSVVIKWLFGTDKLRDTRSETCLSGSNLNPRGMGNSSSYERTELLNYVLDEFALKSTS